LLTAWLRGDAPRLRASLRPGLLVAFGSTAAYLLVLLAFQRAPAGRVSTLREVSVLFGIILAGERPGGRVWTGAILVVGGMALAAG
jgi:drug/metabolite transporter (DMT)-like permease